MCFIEFKNVTKLYPMGDGNVKALADISFRAERGEFIAVTGPSGCGKSTMLHILGGLDRPTSGTVTVDHEALYEMSENGRAAFRRNQAGIVYQFYNLVPELTVEENIALPCILNRQRADPGRLGEILDFLGLQTKRTCFPEQLSGGQQQKTAIGRAMMNRPVLLLADEPTGNLDSAMRDEILELFQRLNEKEKMTVILVTHDAAVAEAAGRTIRMFDGKIVGDEVRL